MNRGIKKWGFRLASIGVVGFAAGCGSSATPDRSGSGAKAGDGNPSWATIVEAKPLSTDVNKGLAYLVNQQHSDGGWGQGGGWRQGGHEGGGRVEGANVLDPSDLGNTCVVTLALLRAGNTPTSGEYAQNVAKAMDYIVANVEKSDTDSLYVTPVRDTQLQSKIGPYVDTFLAALVMAELKGKTGDDKNEGRLVASLGKTIKKIEKNQTKDGTFVGNQAWASVLSQGLCSKALNRADQAGVAVSELALDRDRKQAEMGLDKNTGKFASADATVAGRAEVKGDPAVAAAPAPSDAGVGIYNQSARSAALQESVNSYRARAVESQRILKDDKATDTEKRWATDNVQKLQEAEEAQTAATKGIVSQLGDAQWIQGFGSNGGEEFLSYLNISETLLMKGGKEWGGWDKKITANLLHVQDKDGGWSGHHCITGRTFCTASALLVLMADRTPVPMAAKIKEGK